jgi:hypothetical protein
MANGPRGGGHGLSQQTVAAGSGTWIPKVHSITQRRGPMSVKGMELRLHEHGGLPPPGLNSAGAAAACRSVRDAILQVSLRLQGCQSAVAGRGMEKILGCVKLDKWLVSQVAGRPAEQGSSSACLPGSAALGASPSFFARAVAPSV